MDCSGVSSFIAAMGIGANDVGNAFASSVGSWVIESLWISNGYAIFGLGGFCISLGLFFMVMLKINRYA